MTELRWKTFNHFFHPYGDLIWHVFGGFMAGIFFVSAVFSYHQPLSFVTLLFVSIGLLFFFFYDNLYEPRLMEIRLTNEGFYINQKFYPWENYTHFEIFENGYRKFLFLVSRQTGENIHFPLEEFFVSEAQVRDFVSLFLKEAENSVSLFDKLYRRIFL